MQRVEELVRLRVKALHVAAARSRGGRCLGDRAQKRRVGLLELGVTCGGAQIAETARQCDDALAIEAKHYQCVSRQTRPPAIRAVHVCHAVLVQLRWLRILDTDCGERVRYGAREHALLTLVRLANVNELSSIILQLSTQAPPIGFVEFGLFEKLDYLPSERNRQSGHQPCICTSRRIRHV